MKPEEIVSVLNSFPPTPSTVLVEPFHNLIEVPPYSENDRWGKARESTQQWEVIYTETTIRIKDWDPKRIPRRSQKIREQIAALHRDNPGMPRADANRLNALELEKKWLFAANNGEWGGFLLEYNKEIGKCQWLIRSNVSDLIETASGIVALGGLEHMSLNRGSAYFLSEDVESEPKLTEEIDLGSEPLAYYQCNSEHVFILTRKGIVHLSVLERKATRLVDAKWDGIIPNSLVRWGKTNFLVGCRHAVVQLRWKDNRYMETWLVDEKENDKLSAAEPWRG